MSASAETKSLPFGPVQMLVLEFDRVNFDGSIMPELARLKEAGVARLIDLLHHGSGLRVPRHELGRLVQLLGEQIAHEPVAVVHEHPGGARGERAFDGGVRLRRHEAAEPPVLGGEGRARGVGLGLVDDPGDPFHVDGDVDAHRVKAIFRLYFVLQST